MRSSVCCTELSVFGAIVFGALSFVAPSGADDADARGPVPMPGSANAEVVFQTGFEQDDNFPQPQQHSVIDRAAHSGERCLTAAVDEDTPYRQYRIPIEGKDGRRLRVSLWRRSEHKCRLALFFEVEDETTGELRRKRLYTVHPPGGGWTRVEHTFTPTAGEGARLSIVWPSIHGGEFKPTQAWLDDLRIEDLGPAVGFTLDHAEDFPALTTDGAGRTWLAVTERRDFASMLRPQLGIFRVTEDRRERVCTLRPDGITGISPPALAPLPRGCVVAFGAEVAGEYKLVYARITPDTHGQPSLRTLSEAGTANIVPSLASLGNTVCAVWETNAPGIRSIAAARITPEGHTEARTISSAEHDDCNPDVVAMSDGPFFAAWDSMRDANVDLYGTWCRDGEWQAEMRLTRDPRMERHVSLAAKGERPWLAWQAQSFNGRRINHLSEQRVVVAMLRDGRLKAPRGLHEALGNELLLRPEISFDPQGRLWLTGRKSTGQHSGWQACLWCCGVGWTERQVMWGRDGRWRPVPLTWGDAGGLAAVQHDRLGGVGLEGNWPREVMLVSLDGADASPPGTIETEHLRMPDTDFSLAEQMTTQNARQPRQQVEHAGRRLTLYWGDLHEHTDVSICARAYNPPAVDLYANQRDVELVDFTAITDHGYNTDGWFWAYNRDRVNAYYDPGRFLTLLGEEWTSKSNPPAEPGGPNRYGHRNIIFRNPRYPRFFDCFDGDISPDEIWAQLQGDEFVMIPHQLADWKGKGGGNPPTDWSYHHEHHQPLAEIFQARGSYEYLGCPRQAGQGCPFQGHYLQDAWERGIVIGVIASPDHGGGQGRVGVWADDRTRDSLFEAFHARHTFGTTGPKVALFFGCEEAMIGDKVKRTGDGPLSFQVTAVAGSPVTKVDIFCNNQIVHTEKPDGRRVQVQWTDSSPPHKDKVWYYARVQCEDDALAWSSPIWFVR